MEQIFYFEDLAPGLRFRSREITVSAEEIKGFAAAFDPQPFHLSEREAEQSFFRGLCASGWHTTALTMRLLVESMKLAGGVIGAGMDELRWPAPVRPGDTLWVESEVTELRPSSSRPTIGLVKFLILTKKQTGETVLLLRSNNFVLRRQLGADS
ncbi:MAG: MaoC family dehydratase [Acetobacteraceae bacterium]|nr:MaoC family dehydratase [Acetobacteraceae bacterium]